MGCEQNRMRAGQDASRLAPSVQSSRGRSRAQASWRARRNKATAKTRLSDTIAIDQCRQRLWPWRHEGIEDARRLDFLVPGLARKHEGWLNVERPEGRLPLLGPGARMALFPHHNRPAPGKVAPVDPGREPWIAVRQHMRPVRRIDRGVIDRELGAAGIDERRSKTLMPAAGDCLGHRMTRKLGRLRTVAQERLADLGHRIDHWKGDECDERSCRKMAESHGLFEGLQE